jgi:hypothetical protein
MQQPLPLSTFRPELDTKLHISLTAKAIMDYHAIFDAGDNGVFQSFFY